MASLSEESSSGANGKANSVVNKVKDGRDTLEAMAENLSSDVGRAVDNVSEKTSDFVESTRGYIGEKPLQSIAIAATAGLVVGGLLTKFARRC
jgi:ElaB/YqjD/DUF883 family membrane-anchored ribosome-binding protein